MTLPVGGRVVSRRFPQLEKPEPHPVRVAAAFRGPDGEPLHLPHDNRTDRRLDPGDFYTPDVRARVAELYRPDFDILGYSVS